MARGRLIGRIQSCEQFGKLEVTPEETLFLYENGDVRHIYSDREHPKKDDLWPTKRGNSIGRWKGATLFIDTIEVTTLADGTVLREDPGSLRFLDVEALNAFLAEAGFEVEAQYGDWRRGPITVESTEIVTIARVAS